MFAQLGSVQFDILTGFESLTSTSQYNYAEHAVIEGKPRLQYIGDGLDTVDITIRLHSSFYDPEGELKKLQDEAAKHEALPLVYGNGEYVGKFVVEEISKTTSQTDGKGNIIGVEVSLKLKEYAETNLRTFKKKPEQGLKRKETAQSVQTQPTTDFDPGKIVRQK